MITLKKKTEVLKIVRVFDRVENSVDPWNSTVTAPSLAESMQRTANDNSYLNPSATYSSSSSSSSSTSLGSSISAHSSSSVGTINTSPVQPPTTTSTTSTTTTTVSTLTGSTSQTTPPKDVTPYKQFLTKIFYPNPLVQRPEATGLYKEARDLMGKFDKAFIILIFALLVLYFFKRTD